ncbi:3-hydroxybenzoate 6-hydroxylase 1 [Fusarium phyllophilum]|uniref:3-hydroxybenzoate 6-hydroxylase 1 n=1 Tax=Fusarium phyllophilum TaxID=47803 RepID=A0A8H5KDH3_9HYPO|nr:3-hydroxybenzoate 6-hydroxylase 1 [Fusarium phyllophilum]
MTQDTETRPLNILIVGAGIGGLTAALGLRQQGHKVTLFERSQLAREVGAAIHVAPNSHGLLKRFGVYPETFGANRVEGKVTEYTHDGHLKFDNHLKGPLSVWEHPWVLAHRVSLHENLKNQATSSEGPGTPAILKTSSPVVDVDPSTATVKFEDGTSVSGDLVLGADGVSSITRSIVTGTDIKPYGSGKSAFRFMIPHSKYLNNETTRPFAERTGTMTMWVGDDRRIIMYPCSNNTVMNFVAIHPSDITSGASKGSGWGQGGSKELLLEVYKDFEPRVRAILNIVDASDLKLWTLLDMDRIPTWHKERLVLLGDAAHPFLPHQGQGGGIAIEDAASLVALLPYGTTADDIPSRLSLYEKIRDERAHMVQLFTRQAGEDLDEETRAKFNIYKFLNYNFGHDEWHNTKKALRDHLWSQNKNLHWKSPVSFGPMPSPRQDFHGQRYNGNDSSFTTWSVRFKSSATYLKTLFPTDRFSFYKPGTVAEATFSCTELKDMKWLGGGGYKFFGLWIHGVQYEKKDGSKIYGSFLAVLLENLADPIVTGREELGMPKLFCDIDVVEKGANTSIRCSWRGAEFVDITLKGLGEATNGHTNGTNGDNGTNGHAPTVGPPGAPPLPEEQGLLIYRYVPAVGQPGVADAAYPVFIEDGLETTKRQVEKTLVGSGGDLDLTAGTWDTLPTLNHIATGFSEIPVYGVVKSKVEYGRGVDDISHARRVE